MKMKTRKGFTLTELLIVMAIVVVLAAVAVPTFSKQLETSRETSDMEVIRNAYTEALSIAVLDAADGTINGVIGDGTASATDGTWDKVSFVAASQLYKVTDLKFSQNTPKGTINQTDKSKRQDSWKYVSSSFMGHTLPIVHTGLTALTFKFIISAEEGKAGNVVLKPEVEAAAQQGETPAVAAQYSIEALTS